MGGVRIEESQPSGPQGAMVLTVDVEEWFHVCCVPGLEGPGQWARLESRVDADVDRLLELLARSGVRGTFFILGWLADTRPGLVERVARAGHEIGCHGYGHEPVDSLGPERFEADLVRSLELLRSRCDGPVESYRAPMWSLGTTTTPWAFEILARHGVRIDSSLTRSPLIGDRSHPRGPAELHLAEGTRLHEFPPLAGRLFGVDGVFLGGAWPLRLFGPGRALRAARTAVKQGHQAVFFLHPWELDPDPPRHPMPPSRHFVHYAGLQRGRGVWARLMAELPLVTLGDALAAG